MKPVVDQDVALVSFSHTAYRSGALAPMNAIDELAHSVGALTLWDLSHSVGAVPVDLSRSDLIVDADGQVWFLEVNVAPGLTETSTVPLSVTAAGLDLGDLVADLVRAAIVRSTL